MKRIKANIIFTEPCLGTASADPELHSRFIASNAPDALTRQEEIEVMGVEEYEEKSKGRTKADMQKINVQIMDIFAEFGAIRDTDPASEQAQILVKKLQDFITENMYTCTNEILSGLRSYLRNGSCGTELEHSAVNVLK